MSKNKHKKNFINYKNYESEKNIEVVNLVKDEIKYDISSIELFDEKDFPNWKKIELEILRDKNGNAICIGNREYITDIITVFPIQTITNRAFQEIRTNSIKISAENNFVGNINFKYVINCKSKEFKLVKIDINADSLIQELVNYKEKVIKIRNGEILENIIFSGKEPEFNNIFFNINETIIKAFNLEEGIYKTSCLNKNTGNYFRLEELIENEKNDLEEKLKVVDDNIFFLIAEAIRKDIPVEKICEITKIDKLFVGSCYKIIKMEKELSLNYLNYRIIEKANSMGFSNSIISFLSGKEEEKIEKIISKNII